MLPLLLIEELKSIPGFDLDAYLKALTLAPTRGLHLNLCKGEAKEAKAKVEAELGKDALVALGYTEEGFLCHTEKTVGTLPLHHAGAYYMQEPSAMCPVACLPLCEGMRVLDLCAAPGGKSTQIANRIGNTGLLVSNEINHGRCSVLAGNIERMGIQNAIVTNTDAETLSKYLPSYFDAVVVDAPCSGEGMFRKNPETIDEWSTENVERCFERQKEILEIAEKFVCAGGKLVYSTCTYNKFEDEAVVDWFLENFNFEIKDVNEEIKKVTIPSNIKNGNKDYARKFLPYAGEGEGQFVAVFENKDDDRKTSLYSKKHYRSVSQIGQSENKLVKEFAASSLFEEFSWRDLYRIGGSIFYAPQGFNTDLQTALEDLKFLAVGVKIGTIEKGRFEPSHNIFMAMADKFKYKIELGEDELKKYMHGEELSTNINAKGYGVVTVGGYAIGGVKIVQNRLKNLYPRGLRV